MIALAAGLIGVIAAAPGPVARAARALASTSAETRRAALAEAPDLEGAWALLPAILALDTPEAARAAARIAHPLRDPLTVERLEADRDVLDEARRACADGATSARPGPQRADLLACAVDLGAPLPLAVLLDDDPDVRSTALSLAPIAETREWRDEARRIAGEDADERRRARALAALCAGDARRTMQELDAAGRAALRARALDAATDAVSAERLTSCLRASPDARDRAAAKRRVRRP